MKNLYSILTTLYSLHFSKYSMTETVIKVEKLSKQYRIGAREGYKTFRETLVDAAKAPFRGIKQLINPQSAIRIDMGSQRCFLRSQAR